MVTIRISKMNKVKLKMKAKLTRRNRISLILLFSFSFLIFSCGDERCRTPFGEGGTIDLLQPDFNILYNNPGATLVINRGYRGILVHCTNLYEYVAFECACPYCRETGMVPDDRQRASVLVCPDCGSRFDVFFGNPLDGAMTSCMLYQYSTHYDGRYLSIY